MMFPLIVLFLVAGITLICTGSVGFFTSLPNPPVHQFSQRRQEALKQYVALSFFHPLIQYLAGINERSGGAWQARLDLKLRRADRPCDFSAAEYQAICQVGALLLGGPSTLYGCLIFGFGGIIAGGISAAVGFFAPMFVLNEMVIARTTAIILKLPYAIDLLALCLGAGSTFVGAVEELVRDNKDEPLDREFRIFLTELNLGKTRREALTNVAERCGIDLLTSVVMALIQGEEQGVPVNEILKRQAAHIRNVRMAKADEQAQKASTKILFPTILITMAMLLILFGGFIVKLIRGTVLD